MRVQSPIQQDDKDEDDGDDSDEDSDQNSDDSLQAPPVRPVRAARRPAQPEPQLQAQPVAGGSGPATSMPRDSIAGRGQGANSSSSTGRQVAQAQPAGPTGPSTGRQAVRAPAALNLSSDDDTPDLDPVERRRAASHDPFLDPGPSEPGLGDDIDPYMDGDKSAETMEVDDVAADLMAEASTELDNEDLHGLGEELELNQYGDDVEDDKDDDDDDEEEEDELPVVPHLKASSQLKAQIKRESSSDEEDDDVGPLLPSKSTHSAFKRPLDPDDEQILRGLDLEHSVVYTPTRARPRASFTPDVDDRHVLRTLTLQQQREVQRHNHEDDEKDDGDGDDDDEPVLKSMKLQKRASSVVSHGTGPRGSSIMSHSVRRETPMSLLSGRGRPSMATPVPMSTPRHTLSPHRTHQREPSLSSAGSMSGIPIEGTGAKAYKRRKIEEEKNTPYTPPAGTLAATWGGADASNNQRRGATQGKARDQSPIEQLDNSMRRKLRKRP